MPRVANIPLTAWCADFSTGSGDNDFNGNKKKTNTKSGHLYL